MANAAVTTTLSPAAAGLSGEHQLYQGCCLTPPLLLPVHWHCCPAVHAPPPRTGSIHAAGLLVKAMLLKIETGTLVWDIMTMGNAALAGLVAITSGCSVILPWVSSCACSVTM